MSKTWEEIASTMWMRRNADFHLRAQWQLISEHNSGDVVIPMPDVVNAPDMPPLMPQLIHDGIENMALRAAGATPDLSCPALNEQDDKSLQRAYDRRRAIHARWFNSQFELLLGRAFRQLCGYGTFCGIVLPDFKNGGARLELRDPLSAYPEVRDPSIVENPMNSGFVYGRSADWLISRWPNAAQFINQTQDDTANPSGLWDVIEWVDEDDVVIGLGGPRSLFQNRTFDASMGYEIARYPNRAGMCPVVVPRRLTLDQIAGQLDSIVPLVDWMARLMALDVIAAERATFPDVVIVGDGQARDETGVVGGQWQDGRTGQANVVTGARAVNTLHTDPGQMTGMIIDRLERAGRHAGGIPEQFGGEFSGAIRSGRVIDQMGAFAIDPRVAELQNLMARSLMAINCGIAETERGYFRGRTFTVFSGWAGDRGHLTYQPENVFEDDAKTVVQYVMPGTDTSQLTVAIGQMVQADLMSKDTGRRAHPFVDDPDHEARVVIIERLEDAVLAGVQEQVRMGSLPFVDAVAILREVKAGKDIATATMEAQQAAQARQAAQAAPPGEGQGAPPGTQPGLNMPGVGVEQQQPPEPGSPTGPGGYFADQLPAILRSLGTNGRPSATSEPAILGGVPHAAGLK